MNQLWGYEHKIIELDDLVEKVSTYKARNKTIVSNNGSYDILHLGHINGLFKAASLGDILVVGVNSDSSIKRYKSIFRPINDEHMRVSMLAAISCVDYVFLFDETTPITWLEKIAPDIHTNGAEYGDDCIERDVVEKNGGKIYLLPMTPGYKTSLIIEKMKNCKE